MNNSLIIKRIKEVLKKKGSSFALHEPYFDTNEINELKKCIKSGYVSTIGNYVKKFENKIKSFTRSKYTVSTVNGTSAIHLALKVLNINSSHEVILPTLSFIAAGNAITYCGATPHFVDCEKETLGIDVDKLEKYLNSSAIIKKKGFYFNKKTKKKIKAIIAVHVFGNPMKIERLVRVAKKFNLRLIEDAAEALGSKVNGRHVGTFGDIGILSFNGNKIITSGGGGMMITNNRKLAYKGLHLSTTAKKPHKWEYFHNEIGFNYRLPNINAALGYSQLKKLKKNIYLKRKLFQVYKKKLSGLKDILLLEEMKKNKSNYWLNTIILKKPNKKKRDKLLKDLYINKIYSRPIWNLLHTLPMFRKCPKSNLNNSKDIFNSIINIPSSAFLAD